MQTNTKILAQEFEYLAPKTLDEALDLLEKYKDKNIRILAGGTDLLVKTKTIDLKVDYLINIKNISAPLTLIIKKLKQACKTTERVIPVKR